MKVQVTRQCGHAETIGVFGSSQQRERQVSYESSRVCQACREAQYQARAAEAAAAARAAGLPQLEGTERQVAWAEQLRQRRLAELEQLVADYERRLPTVPEADRERAAGLVAEMRAAVARARTVKSAAYWIDRRDWTPLDHMERLVSAATSKS